MRSARLILNACESAGVNSISDDGEFSIRNVIFFGEHQSHSLSRNPDSASSLHCAALESPFETFTHLLRLLCGKDQPRVVSIDDEWCRENCGYDRCFHTEYWVMRRNYK